MKTSSMKSVALAAVLVVASMAARAGVEPFAVVAPAADTTVDVSQTAVLTGSLLFTRDFLLAGGAFTMSFDAAALSFQAADSFIHVQQSPGVGVSFAFDALATGGAVDLTTPGSVTLLALLPSSAALPSGASIGVDLSFKGNLQHLGTHAVAFSAISVTEELPGPDVADWSLPDASFTVTVTAVPEPATYALMLGGLAAIAALARRRARQV